MDTVMSVISLLFKGSALCLRTCVGAEYLLGSKYEMPYTSAIVAILPKQGNPETIAIPAWQGDSWSRGYQCLSLTPRWLVL